MDNEEKCYVGKTFAGFTSSELKVLKKAIAQKIHWENCRVSLKTTNFLTFVVYSVSDKPLVPMV